MNVVDDAVLQQVPHALFAPQSATNFRGADLILDPLGHYKRKLRPG